MPDNTIVEQHTTNHIQQLSAQLQQTQQAQPELTAASDCQNILPALTQAVQSQPCQNEQYQHELQQQRLRNLATELNAISDPSAKMQFIENRLLENLQHLKRQLAILQQALPGSGAAGNAID